MVYIQLLIYDLSNKHIKNNKRFMNALSIYCNLYKYLYFQDIKDLLLDLNIFKK